MLVAGRVNEKSFFFSYGKEDLDALENNNFMTGVFSYGYSSKPLRWTTVVSLMDCKELKCSELRLSPSLKQARLNIVKDSFESLIVDPMNKGKNIRFCYIITGESEIDEDCVVYKNLIVRIQKDVV